MAIVGVASIRIKPDLTEFRQELMVGLKKIKAEITVGVEADVARARQTVQRFVETESRKNITKRIEVERSSLSRAASLLSRIGRTAVGITAVTTGFVAMTSVLQFLIPLLAATLGAILLLPAAIGGLVGVIATVALGVEGIKKAFEGLKPVLNTLRSQVAKSFELSFIPAVQNLRKILPQLRTGFQSIATAIGGAVTKLTLMLREGDNTQRLNSFLILTSRLIQNVGNALGPVVQAFIDVANIGGGVLLELTNHLGRAAQRMADFARSTEGAAQIDKAIRGALAAFRTIGQFLVQLGGIVAAVFNGISDGAGSMGGAVLPLLTKINAALSSVQGQATLQSIGRALAALGQAISNTIGPAIQRALPKLKEFFDFIARNADVIGPMVVAFGAFALIVPKLVGAFLLLKTVLTGLFAVLAANPITLVIAAIVGLLAATGQLGPVINILKNVFNTLKGPIERLVKELLPHLRELFGRLKAPMGKVVGAIKQIVDATLPLIVKILELAGPVFGFLIDVVTAVIGPLSDFAAFLAGVVAGAVEILMDSVSAVIGFISNFGTISGKVAKAVGGFFSGLGESIGKFFAMIGRWFSELPGRIGGFLASLPGVLARAFQAAFEFALKATYEGIQWIIAAAIALPIRLGLALFELGTILGELFIDAWNWARAKTVEGIAALIDFISNLPGRILNAIVSMASGLASWASNAWKSATSATGEGIGSLIAFITTLPGKILRAIVSIITDLRNFFVRAWHSARDGVVEGLSAVLDFVRGIPGRVVDSLGNLWNTLYEAGKSIIQGFLNGIKAAAQAVWDFVSGIAAKIAALKGPLPYDRKLLIPAGLAIMQGLISGLTSGFRDVLGLVGGMADQIGGMFGSSAFNVAAGLQATVGSTISATGKFEPTPVVVNINTDHELLQDFIQVEIDEGGRAVRRAVYAGGGTQ
jgi:phage-related protein